MVFTDEFIADESQIRSVLDYAVEIRELPQHQQNYVAITGIKQLNMDGYWWVSQSVRKIKIGPNKAQ